MATAAFNSSSLPLSISVYPVIVAPIVCFLKRHGSPSWRGREIVIIFAVLWKPRTGIVFIVDNAYTRYPILPLKSGLARGPSKQTSKNSYSLQLHYFFDYFMIVLSILGSTSPDPPQTILLFFPKSGIQSENHYQVANIKDVIYLFRRKYIEENSSANPSFHIWK